jgi:hypothetical protein
MEVKKSEILFHELNKNRYLGLNVIPGTQEITKMFDSTLPLSPFLNYDPLFSASGICKLKEKMPIECLAMAFGSVFINR